MPEWMKGLLSSGVYFDTANEGNANGGEGEGDGNSNANEGGDAKNGNEKESKEKEGLLSEEKAKLIKDMMKHKAEAAKLAKELADAKKLADENKAKRDSLEAELAEVLGDEGLEGLKKIQADKAKAAEEAAKNAGKFDELMEQVNKRHNKAMGELRSSLEDKIKALEAERSELDQAVRQLLVSNAFANSAWRNENLVLAPGHAERLYGDAFKVEKREGRPMIVAYKGSEPLVDDGGNPLSFEDAFKAIVESDPDHVRFLKTKGKGGAGSGQGGRQSGEGAPPSNEKVRGLGRIQLSLKPAR